MSFDMQNYKDSFGIENLARGSFSLLNLVSRNDLREISVPSPQNLVSGIDLGGILGPSPQNLVSGIGLGEIFGPSPL